MTFRCNGGQRRDGDEPDCTVDNSGACESGEDECRNATAGENRSG
jgi:hypothetical protein